MIYIGCVSDNTANDIYSEQLTAYDAGIVDGIHSVETDIESVLVESERKAAEQKAEEERLAAQEAAKLAEAEALAQREADAISVFDSLSDVFMVKQDLTKVSEVTYHIFIDSMYTYDMDLDFTELLLDEPELRPVLEHLFANGYNFERNYIGQITDPNSIYVMANKMNQLPEDYVPVGLVIPDVRSTTNADVDKRYVRPEMAEALESLFTAAEAEGLILYTASGYRSYNTQVLTYNRHVANKGLEAADKVSARAGHSEHQTGITMDVTCEGVNFRLEEELGVLPEGIFIKENAHKYGLIIRYLENKTNLTGYSYEPWHLRYVGIPLATFLYENDLTLEEFYFFVQTHIKEKQMNDI